MADREITAQIDKLRKTRPARAVDVLWNSAGDPFAGNADALIAVLSMLRDDLKEECRLLEHAKIKGGVTLIKDRTAVAGWLELFVLQLSREAERDSTGLTVPCDGSCGNADPHDAHLAPGALKRLSPSPELGEHRPSDRGTDAASLPGPGGRCAVGNVHDEHTLKCPCGFRAPGVHVVDLPNRDGIVTVDVDPPIVGPATIMVRMPVASAHEQPIELSNGDTITSISTSQNHVIELGLNGAVSDYLSGLTDQLDSMNRAQFCPDCDRDTHRCGGCGASVEHGMYACLECAAQDSAAYLADAIEPLQQEVHNAIDRELPDVHADPVVDPFAPIPRVNLGTPAVPPGGHEVTTSDLLTPVDASLLPGHLSFSQVTTVTDCGAKYRLQRVEKLPQVPQWANVGGQAFHACVENFEVAYFGAGGTGPGTQQVDIIWLDLFEREIKATEQASSMVRDQFRASQQGRENYDWWRVEGAAMLQRYVDWRQTGWGDGADQQVLIGPGGAPMLEWQTTYDVDGVPFTTILDSVWVKAVEASGPGVAIIRDWKTGAGVPDDRQLCTQAWGLRRAGWQGPILAQFFDARKGTFTELFDPFERMGWDDVRYFVLSGYASTRQSILPARPSDFCGGCSVAYACPIMRQRRAAKVK